MSASAARRWALFFFASILFGTLMPASWRDSMFGLLPHGVIFQKAGHVACFAGAAFLLIRGAFWPAKAWQVFGVGLLLAMGTEALRMLVRGRSPSVRDLLLDMAGVCIGLLCARIRSSGAPLRQG
jgi:hypothetical protein